MSIIIGGSIVGILMIAIASRVYWRIGQPENHNARWRNLPGIESIIVLIVLGGWVGGAILVVKSIVLAMSS